MEMEMPLKCIGNVMCKPKQLTQPYPNLMRSATNIWVTKILQLKHFYVKDVPL